MELSQRIERMVARLEREDVNMHGLLLSVGGELRAEVTWAPFTVDAPHRLYSVSKTMTGIAVGMLADEGKLSLDDPIAGFFADWLPEHPDGRLMRLRLRDMLRMATCYSRTAYREGIDENWARAFFTGRPTHEPGALFHYDTGCSQVLAALVRRVSGQEVVDFLRERLWKPLGCEDGIRWLRDPSGCCTGGTGLCMSLRDLHRTAQCAMDGGRGLIPAWWAAEMGRKHIDTPLCVNEEERYGYGWQCWRTRAGWAMYGMGGQLAVICPEKGALLSTIADTRLDPFGVQRIYNAFFEEVYPFIGEEDMALRAWRRSALAVPDHREYGLAESPLYRFPEDNPLQLRSLRLQGDCLLYENARGRVELPFGRGICLRTAWPGWPEVPALSSGGWLAPDLLRVRVHAVGDAPCGADLLLRFGKDAVTMQSRRSSDPVTAGYEGVASGRAE